jgi:hypothetical protein
MAGRDTLYLYEVNLEGREAALTNNDDDDEEALLFFMGEGREGGREKKSIGYVRTSFIREQGRKFFLYQEQK